MYRPRVFLYDHLRDLSVIWRRHTLIRVHLYRYLIYYEVGHGSNHGRQNLTDSFLNYFTTLFQLHRLRTVKQQDNCKLWLINDIQVTKIRWQRGLRRQAFSARALDRGLESRSGRACLSCRFLTCVANLGSRKTLKLIQMFQVAIWPRCSSDYK